MTSEVFIALSSIVFGIWSAYLCRKSFTAIHLAALSLFMFGVTILRVVFGGKPSQSNMEVTFFTYMSVMLYLAPIVLMTLATRDQKLRQVVRYLGGYKPTLRECFGALTGLALLWGIRFYRASAYGILYSGSSTEEAIAQIPYWLSISNSILSFLGGGAFIVIVLSAAKRRLKWLWVVVGVEVVWFLVSGGRREFVFFCLIVTFVLWSAKTIGIQKAVTGILLIAVVLLTVSPLFLKVRDLNSTYQYRGVATFSSFGRAFVEAYNHCGIGFNCFDRAQHNARSRGNAFEFLRQIVDREKKGYSFLLGSGLLNALIWGIPSIIIGKPPLMVEQLVQDRFGIPKVDDAISIPSLAYADGGLMGCFVAGITIFLFVYTFSRFAIRQKSNLLQISMIYGLISLMWNIEADPLAFAVLVRDAFIIAMMFKAFLFFRVKN